MVKKIRDVKFIDFDFHTLWKIEIRSSKFELFLINSRISQVVFYWK